MKPFIVRQLHTEEQIAMLYNEVGSIVLEIKEIADNSSNRFYMNKDEAMSLIKLITEIINE